jgi:hypothetical protein
VGVSQKAKGHPSGWPFVCMGTYEVILTAVFHPDSNTWDMWVTQTDERSQYELVAFASDVHPAIVKAFHDARNAIVDRSQF